MKNKNRSMPLLAATILILATWLTAIPAHAQQPPFSATITITGDTEIFLGESTLLTADWTTNRDVTRCEWSVNEVGQGPTSIDGASEGSSTFNFVPSTTGTFTISFRIWHHVQTDRDASNSVTVTVSQVESEYEYETAFAYGREIYASPFSDFGFARWGWTNGPLATGFYTFDLYAGAAQNDLSKGILVGTIDIVYDGTSVTVIFNVNSPYILDETHIYAGSDRFPLNNGEPTVAPGQYYVDSLSDSIYIIGHAVVGIPE